MIKHIRELIEELQELADEYGNIPIIQSEDAEGNDFLPVHEVTYEEDVEVIRGRINEIHEKCIVIWPV